MADLTTHSQAAFTAANDWSKQVLALSTGILALTISLGDTLFGVLSDGEKQLLWISWGLYLVSILGGLWVLMALTGTMGKTEPPAATAIYGWNVRISAGAQFLCFLLATGVLVAFGISTVGNPPKPDKEESSSAPPIVMTAANR